MIITLFYFSCSLKLMIKRHWCDLRFAPLLLKIIGK